MSAGALRCLFASSSGLFLVLRVHHCCGLIDRMREECVFYYAQGVRFFCVVYYVYDCRPFLTLLIVSR